jgi:flagellar biosynthesis/type III secretory pathway protein FliH
MNDRAMLWYERWKQEGKEEGFREGLERGRQEGRQQGRQEGRQEGIQLGRQEGIQLGRQEGFEQGRRRGEAELLLRLLRSKFGPVPKKIQARLRNAQPEQLLEWGERLVKANSLDEVFQ